MKPFLFIGSFFFVGCMADSQQAPANASISFLPSEIALGANPSFSTTDLSGRLLLVNALVTISSERWTASYELPLENVQVDITSLYDGIYILPQEAVELVSYPSLPADVQSVDDVRDQCTDENGYYSHSAGDWCAWYWDTESNSFYQFNDTYASAYQEIDDEAICGEGNAPCEYWFAPTHLKSSTNSRGILPLYILVDTLPSGGEAQVFGTTGFQGGILTITGDVE
jgi:hypothetical protein